MKMNIEELTAVAVARNLLVRQNPVLGFTRRTPFREWACKVLDWACKSPTHFHYFVKFVFINLGNRATSYILPPEPTWSPFQTMTEEFRKLLSEARGSGRQHARDCGGWVWLLIRIFADTYFNLSEDWDIARKLITHAQVRGVYSILALHGITPTTIEDVNDGRTLGLRLVHKLTEKWLQYAPCEILEEAR